MFQTFGPYVSNISPLGLKPASKATIQMGSRHNLFYKKL